MTSNSSHIGNPFKIAGLELPNRVAQAPMAGISTRAFRLQARRHGAGFTWTEMVSSYGVHYRNKRTLSMLELVDDERPVAVQIFGSRPEMMAQAAAAAEEAGADMIDINMGCPVRKVVKTGAGVALMEDEKLAARIVMESVAAVTVPVTAKIRSGPGKSVTAPDFARRMEDAGAAALCIHSRLGSQGRKGDADQEVTRTVSSRLGIPVIASGDIDSPESARHVMALTGCAAVMVARAALGAPWIFSDIIAGNVHQRPLAEVVAEMKLFYGDVESEMGLERAGRFMRKFYGWYLAPFKPDARLRDRLRRAESFAVALEAIGDWRDRLATG